MSLLGVDIGTTGCKAVAFSLDGEIVASAYREYAPTHPRPGWCELDAGRVVELVFEVLAETAAATKTDPIRALCIGSMGEAVVPVSDDGRILDTCIIPTADSRGAEYLERFTRELSADDFYAINGNILGVNYTMPKLKWLEDHRPGVYHETSKFLLWPDLIALKLGCEPFTSFSHASRTLLFDVRKEQWSERLLALAGIERSKLPDVAPSGRVLGEVSRSVAGRLGLPAGVAVVSGAHDQCCVSLGSGVFEPGRAVCGIGTVECITPTYNSIPDTRGMVRIGLNVEHHILPGLYVSFIYNQAGSLVRWFRNTFAAADARYVGEQNVYQLLDAEVPAEPTDLLVLPYFEMTGAPTFIDDASGAIVGLRTSTQRGEILKAIMECETFYFVESMETVRKLGADTSEIVASGGGARSDVWLQIKADILGIPIVRIAHTEAGTTGAAMMAGIATGALSGVRDAAERFVRLGDRFEPRTKYSGRYAEKYEDYRRLYPALRELL